MPPSKGYSHIWNRAFIKSKLGDVYSTGRAPVTNLDLNAIQAQLSTRTGTKFRDTHSQDR
ncbi:hypothetical protein MPDQ_005203, partial [Monascus purpureus]